MFASPFGEKFHFRTPLSVDETIARIDSLFDDSLYGTNYSRDPVSIRRRERFWLHENNALRPPSLNAKIVSNRGWTEIVGRGGSNLLSLWSAILTFVLFVVVGCYVLLVERDSTGIGALIGSVPASAFAYARFWQDPDSGYLIDYLQDLLDAEPVTTRKRD